MDETTAPADLAPTAMHSGRRKRLRRRFLAHGLTNFNEFEVLEFALGYVIPRVDTNTLAHSLIHCFGNLNAVFRAQVSELIEIPGVGEQAAQFISFLGGVMKYHARQTLESALVKPSTVVQYLEPIMRNYHTEQLVITALDQNGHVKTLFCVQNNDPQQIKINFGEIITRVTACKAVQVVMAHNHLDGRLQPSMADMATTRRLAQLLKLLGIQMIDHLIFCGSSYYSFHQSGLLDSLRITNFDIDI